MSFLQRRRSQPLLAGVAAAPPVRSTSWGKSRASPRRLIKQVSSIFRRKSSHAAPVCNIAVRGPRPSYSSSTASSEDDIRRPSGLGSRASVDGLEPRTSMQELEGRDGPGGHPFHERPRTLSSPAFLLSPSRVPWMHDPDPMPSPTKETRNAVIPREIWDVVLSFLPLNMIPSLATVSKSLCAASYNLLYKVLDGRTIHPDQFEKLNSLLASRRDIAELVHDFGCFSWPASFKTSSFSPSNSSIIPFLHTPTTTISISLCNMCHLTELTLPSFDNGVLGNRIISRLKSLTLLNHSMSPDEQVALFSWLESQPTITSLCFPNLVDIDVTSKVSDASAKHPTPPSPKFPRPVSRSKSAPSSPVSSASTQSFPMPMTTYSSCLLPHLESLHAPPTLTTRLVLTRPVKRVTLSIHSTLYTGLRPSTIMAALRGVKELNVRFDENVDRRSVEKVLGAVGSVLGEERIKRRADRVDFERPDYVRGELEVLGVEMAWLDGDLDEALYKALHSVLPRLKVLHTLRLSLSSNYRSTDSILSDCKTLSEQEQICLSSWFASCESLQNVRFLSGVWGHADD